MRRFSILGNVLLFPCIGLFGGFIAYNIVVSCCVTREYTRCDVCIFSDNAFGVPPSYSSYRVTLFGVEMEKHVDYRGVRPNEDKGIEGFEKLLLQLCLFSGAVAGSVQSAIYLLRQLIVQLLGSFNPLSTQQEARSKA